MRILAYHNTSSTSWRQIMTKSLYSPIVPTAIILTLWSTSTMFMGCACFLYYLLSLRKMILCCYIFFRKEKIFCPKQQIDFSLVLYQQTRQKFNNKFQNIFVNAGGVLGDNLRYSKIKRCFEDIVQTI